jgi:hypothetical protein
VSLANQNQDFDDILTTFEQLVVKIDFNEGPFRQKVVTWVKIGF